MAYLHSVLIQEKKNMLKMWNVVLIMITFILTIFGTYLTRSGILSSVHAFAATEERIPSPSCRPVPRCRHGAERASIRSCRIRPC